MDAVCGKYKGWVNAGGVGYIPHGFAFTWTMNGPGRRRCNALLPMPFLRLTKYTFSPHIFFFFSYWSRPAIEEDIGNDVELVLVVIVVVVLVGAS